MSLKPVRQRSTTPPHTPEAALRKRQWNDGVLPEPKPAFERRAALGAHPKDTPDDVAAFLDREAFFWDAVGVERPGEPAYERLDDEAEEREALAAWWQDGSPDNLPIMRQSVAALEWLMRKGRLSQDRLGLLSANEFCKFLKRRADRAEKRRHSRSARQ